MSVQATPSAYRFDRFRLDPSERRLLADGQPMAVGPRAFNLLVALVERAGQLVSKDELLDRVWPKLVVEENNLQVQVSALRKILGAEAIATVPGHGYRFTLKPTHETVAPAPYNLPRQISSFVGRAGELAEVRALLERARLLTLVGFGGLGKTRLALEVATGVANAYPDGVWLVELAPLTDARRVPQAVASVLGVREEPGRPVVEALLKHVAERRLLLILDSCEHLLQACAELTGPLLQSGPHLKLLATSRERLHLPGEASYVVRALALPEPNPVIAVSALTEYEAVRLFVDRAVAAQPMFVLTRENAAAVADICRHVDGIPLAIELAAARARMLPVEKIAERLRDRLRLLTHGDRTALPHRQTLRAMIDWSYDLLTEPERALLRRLAVFAGGLTLEAAEAVGAGGDVEAIDVLDLLTELVEKSLVLVEAGAERYRLLDTVREYAQERLDESGDGDRTRTQHLMFYLEFAEGAKEAFYGAEQVAWFARFELERENFLAAHAWGGQTARGAELRLRLVFAMRQYWIHRGGLGLGYKVAMEALTGAHGQIASLARCQGLYAAAKFASCIGNYAEANALLEESLSIARMVGNDERIAMALHSLGEQSYAQGRPEETRRRYEEALPLARRVENKIPLIASLMGLAALYRLERNLDAAEELYREALPVVRDLGDFSDVIVGLINLACLSMAKGFGEPSRELLFEALEYVERMGSRALGASVLHISAGLAAFLGEWRRAAQFRGAATAQCEQIGFHPDPLDEELVVPLIAKARAALGTSAFTAAEAAGRALSYVAALAETRAWLREDRTMDVGERL